MTETISDDEIRRIIVKNISEALLSPPEKVVPSARLISDLNAESIDVADIRFRLEHDFNMKLDHKGMVESLGTNLSAEEFDNRFTVQFVIDHVKRQLAALGGKA
jgi:acyl carrier protein